MTAVAKKMTEYKLEPEDVLDYLSRFNLIMEKCKKLEPIANFKVPKFRNAQDLKLLVTYIPSPFS